jgi:hypothetical protein
MGARFPVWAVLALSASLLGRGTDALAQSQGGAAVSGNQPQQPNMIQMYGNMGVNPYLNPYVMGSQGNSDYLLYMYAQNQRNGGIGSGVISGTRPAPGAPAGSAPQGSHPINESTPYAPKRTPGTKLPPARRTSILPGDVSSSGISNTGGYFQRGPGISGGAGRYFNRTQPARAQNNGG